MFTAIGIIICVAFAYVLIKKIIINPLMDDIDRWQDRAERRRERLENRQKREK